MKKFVCVYRVPLETMQKWKAETPSEEMVKQGKQIGEKMNAWMQKYEKAIVDKGLPLGKNTRVTAESASAISNDLNAYIVIEAESADAVVAMFKDRNPQFDIPTAYVDVMEVPEFKM